MKGMIKEGGTIQINAKIGDELFVTEQFTQVSSLKETQSSSVCQFFDFNPSLSHTFSFSSWKATQIMKRAQLLSGRRLMTPMTKT